VPSCGARQMPQNRHFQQVDMASRSDILIFLYTNAFFITCHHLLPFWIAVFAFAGAFLAWKGFLTLQVTGYICVILFLEWLLPLPKAPHFNEAYCCAMSMEAGMIGYCEGEVKQKGKLQRGKNYLFGIYPHGLWPVGHHLLWPHLMSKYEIAPITTTVSTLAFWIPFLRRHFHAHNMIGTSREEMMWAMRQKHPYNVTFHFPGGLPEMFYGSDHEQIVLRKRKGFIRFAMQAGCSLVPSYCFGTNQQYRRLAKPGGIFETMSSFLEVSIIPWIDRFGIPFGFMPMRQKILVAVGEPLEVEQVLSPTREQVDAVHAKFCESLRVLFDEHKGSVGWQDKQLYFEDELPSSDVKTKPD